MNKKEVSDLLMVKMLFKEAIGTSQSIIIILTRVINTDILESLLFVRRNHTDELKLLDLHDYSRY